MSNRSNKVRISICSALKYTRMGVYNLADVQFDASQDPMGEISTDLEGSLEEKSNI